MRFEHLGLIPVSEVAKKFGVKKRDTIKKWLNANNIPLHKVCGRLMIFELELAFKIDLLYAKMLKLKHPDSWEQMYSIAALDEKVARLVMLELKGRVEHSAISMVETMDKSDLQILKDLRNG
ncbi:MAG: hypothetical protein COC01_06755 [Bacteroidetes bacterium]|nr:MAG: hypothetical protein COC01_06755 [Bacteroidota bacterium]